VTPRLLRRGAVVLAALALAALACYQDPTSPAQCPAFCPGGRLATVESLLATSVERDSSFQNYVAAQQSALLLATDLPGIDSRPIFESVPITTRVQIDTGTDTTTGPLVLDSMQLTLKVLRRSAGARNIRLAVYQLPLGLDSTTTLAGLAPSFAAVPLRVVNVDSLVTLPGKLDSATGDSVLVVDSLRNAITVRLKFQASQIAFRVADSGKVALGIRASADSVASIAVESNRSGAGPQFVWYARVDSAGVIVRPDSLPKKFAVSQPAGARFNSFVFTAPPVTIDTNLTIGGVPSTRSLLRIVLPRALRDSTQIIRATLLLVPTGLAPVTTPESVFVQARRVAADLGAKSPTTPDTLVANSAPFRGAPTDTVRVELTTFFRQWQLDTAAVTAVYLSLLAVDRTDSTRLAGFRPFNFDAETFEALRFFSSRAPAFRPAIQLTFVRRLTFGAF
jgi:hypothetical protein